VTKHNALAVMVVLLAISAVFANVQIFRLSNQIAGNQRNDTQALCAFRGDLSRRVQSSIDYLAAHPNGILGIPAATIRLSLDNEQHTLTALSSLKC
jgi:hypothetical protein